MSNITYSIGAGFLRLLSRIPLWFLYAISSCLRPFVQHILRYRIHTVQRNIRASFPNATNKELKQITHDFYAFFCDYIVETLKMATISPKEIQKRFVFEGLDHFEKLFQEHDIVFLYLGHYCNWEWVTSIGLWLPNQIHPAQLYKPIRNNFLNRYFLEIRSRFRGENIDKNKSLRRILDIKRKKEKTIVGFISDQSPKVRDIHDWVDFLHQPTPVFTGGERIAKKVNAGIAYADIKRTSRGHYKAHIIGISDNPTEIPNWQITETFMQLLEQTILRDPAYWLWSHKRWKHKPQDCHNN